MRGLRKLCELKIVGAALIGLVSGFSAGVPRSAHAGPAEVFVRDLPAKIAQRARTFDVDAGLRLGTPSCRPLAGGRACIVPAVQGIVFTVLEKDGKVIAAQATITRRNVRDQKDIGRAINAVLLAAYDTDNQRTHDALALTGAMCVLSGASRKVGPVDFEATSGGCVITIDR